MSEERTKLRQLAVYDFRDFEDGKSPVPRPCKEGVERRAASSRSHAPAGSLPEWTKSHAKTTDYASGEPMVKATDCAKLEEWAIQAARKIEEWAYSTDLTQQMPGCRGILEMCPVDFYLANAKDQT